MAADDLVLDPEPLEDADELSVLARGDLDLVAAGREPLDDRPQDERVRGSGAVDPDPHAAKLTAPAAVGAWGESR